MALVSAAPQARGATQPAVIGPQVLDGLALGLFELRVVQAGGERARDAARDFVLRVENRLERHVVAVGPDVMSPLGLDEFRADADRPRRPAHAARQQIADTEKTGRASRRENGG